MYKSGLDLPFGKSSRLKMMEKILNKKICAISSGEVEKGFSLTNVHCIEI